MLLLSEQPGARSAWNAYKWHLTLAFCVLLKASSSTAFQNCLSVCTDSLRLPVRECLASCMSSWSCVQRKSQAMTWPSTASCGSWTDIKFTFLLQWLGQSSHPLCPMIISLLGQRFVAANFKFERDPVVVAFSSTFVECMLRNSLRRWVYFIIPKWMLYWIDSEYQYGEEQKRLNTEGYFALHLPAYIPNVIVKILMTTLTLVWTCNSTFSKSINNLTNTSVTFAN